MNTDSIKDFLISYPSIYDYVQQFYRIFYKTDVIEFLNSFSKSQKKPLNFIQIGANDGLVNDPIRYFILNKRWRGILVEPLPNVFKLLERNYKNHHEFNELKFLNLAVSGNSSEIFKIWTYDQTYLEKFSYGKQLQLLRKSSFDRDHLLKFIPQSDYNYIVHETVSCISMNDLYSHHFKNHYPKLDLLIMDAEGHELEILAEMDFNLVNPELIIAEASHFNDSENSQFKRLLSINGYEILVEGSDIIAQKKLP